MLSCERAYRQLFSGLQLDVSEGDVVRIKGPNGSGKSTLLKVITGISTDYDGDIRFQGIILADVIDEYRQSFCYLGHAKAVKKSLSPRENLQFFASLYPCTASVSIDDALTHVGLEGFEDTPCQALSAGQQQRVALARLGISAARLWILDEPFTAIDVDGVQLFETMISEFAEAGGAVIITTHHHLQLKTPVLELDLQEYV
ncbi:Cytochrome c biogenesis ATP-binding export protein CcmA [BD1-7 clade bacterium]|uniref:Cytochrome c biogenesis ATP-binding export protein CcmA n=1 Tax=BD1-7 clade bacterium TaxID=2029982 RepID=A0A5S9QS97_9GAMM|nr:Cytochrome c biogenesis ATP-binding export protein CcmA [BD1-7 clade bacterium]